MSIVYNLYSILLCAKYHFQCKNIVQAMYYILQSNVSVAVFRVDVNQLFLTSLIAYSVASLWNISVHEAVITFLKRYPVISKSVHRFSRQEIHTMLLNMCLDISMRSSDVEFQDMHVHVKSDVMS